MVFSRRTSYGGTGIPLCCIHLLVLASITPCWWTPLSTHQGHGYTMLTCAQGVVVALVLMMEIMVRKPALRQAQHPLEARQHPRQLRVLEEELIRIASTW